MYSDRTIAVVVPAYNEELLIADTLFHSPAFVDRIYAVNDASTDRTQAIIERPAEQDPRIIPLQHEKNCGCWCSDHHRLYTGTCRKHEYHGRDGR